MLTFPATVDGHFDDFGGNDGGDDYYGWEPPAEGAGAAALAAAGAAGAGAVPPAPWARIDMNIA